MKNGTCKYLFFIWLIILFPNNVFAHQDLQEDLKQHQRIVDPTKFPKRSSLFALPLLAPFRWLAPRIDRGLTAYEKGQASERLQIILSNPHIRPLFGSLGDGSGFGGGIYLSTADRFSKNFTIFASAQATTKRYAQTIVGLELDPTGGEKRIVTLDFTLRLQVRPEESFYGVGPASFKSDRSDYNLQERAVNATAKINLSRGLRVGFGIDYSSNRIFNGDDNRFTDIGELFNANSLPGLSRGAALLSETAFIEYEGRDSIGNPHSGSYLRFAATNNDSVGSGNFGYVNYLVDARGYIPLATKRRTLALRLLGDFNIRKGGAEIPFFRLARLGTANTLRGYDTYRFHADNALAGNIEYRYQLVDGIAAVLFTDIGQVYNQRAEFTAKNLHASFGGGVHIGSMKRVLLRLLVAKSGEGTRFYFGFGPSF